MYGNGWPSAVPTPCAWDRTLAASDICDGLEHRSAIYGALSLHQCQWVASGQDRLMGVMDEIPSVSTCLSPSDPRRVGRVGWAERPPDCAGLRGLQSHQMFTPDGYPHRRLFPMANGASWLEGISRVRFRLWSWLPNSLGNLICKRTFALDGGSFLPSPVFRR